MLFLSLKSVGRSITPQGSIGTLLGASWTNANFKGTPVGDWYLPDPDGEQSIIPNLTAISSGTRSPIDVIGGGDVGFNWQFHHIIFGIESDWSGWGLSHSSTSTGPEDPLIPGTTLTATTSVKSTWLATIRPRIGIVNNNWLLYATGGVAFSRVNFSQSVYFSASNTMQAGSVANTLVGFCIGSGLEYKIRYNWSVKGEYLFVKFPNQSIQELNQVSPTFGGITSNKLRSSIFRVGVNYKLNWL